MPRVYTRIPLAERFWEKVYFDTTERGCWIWTATRFQSTGYGFIRYFSERTKKWTARGAHRVAWELTYGSVPDDLGVLHRCDNRPCVRPDHLFIGTQKDNHYDAMSKGRHSHGESHGMSRLTSDDVAEIRYFYEVEGVSQVKLAKEYGVARTTIGWIVRGEHWKR